MIHYLITALIDFAAAIYVLSAPSKAPRSTALYFIATGIWSIELFYLSHLPNTQQLYTIFHFTRWGMFFLPAAFSLMAYQLLGEKRKYYFNYIVLPCFFISIALCFSNVYLFPSILKEVENGFLPEKDIIYFIFSAEIAYAAIFTIAYAIGQFQKALKKDRQRTMWGTLPVIFFSGLGLLLIFLMGKDYYLSKHIGTIANILYLGIALYVTNQKSLLDMRKALSLSTSHTIVMLLILAMNACLISALSGYAFSFSDILIISAALTPAIILYSKAAKSGSFVVENLIDKNSYDQTQTITALSDSLNEATTLNHVFIILNNTFTNTVKIFNFDIYEIIDIEKLNSSYPFNIENKLISTTRSTPCAKYAATHKQYFFSDEAPTEVRQHMENNSYEIIVPLFTDSQLSFLLCVGKPNKSSLFRQEDIAIFKWMQKELPQTIERVKQFEKTQLELNDARKSLSMLSVMNQYHHDIKTPLAIIDGVISTDVYDQDKQRDIILKQVARGTELISIMAGILNGKRNRNITTIHLHELIQHCAILFESRFEKIHTRFSQTQKILGDEADLKILFTNLIKNSAEAASQTKALTLTIKIWDENDLVCISLRDTGIGMKKESIDQIWENHHSSKKTGNAIGLHVIKRIADEHNAEISVESEHGEGTLFKLKFPRTKLTDTQIAR